MIKVIVTATTFENFFELRNHEAAQPEIHELAKLMQEIYESNEPVALSVGDWHTPYFGDGYWINEPEENQVPLSEALAISASCCAQVSYRKNDDSLEKAERIHERLITDRPMHASPMEHQATPIPAMEIEKLIGSLLVDDISAIVRDGPYLIPASGNLYGWRQYRKVIEGEMNV